MTKERACANKELLPSEQAERVAQLALVGQAALNTNLSEPHVGAAVASLLQVIAEFSDGLVETLQELQS